MQIQEIQIAGMSCRLFLPLGYGKGIERYPVIYINGDVPISDILTILVKNKVQTDFLMLSVRPENWNDDFTPWGAPAFRKGETPPQGKAAAYIAKLTGQVKPYMDMNYRTMPEPEHTALFGYSLGGLTAIYSLYLTDAFGTVGSLSGSLWYDGFCEFMEKEKVLRKDVRIYFSLGKKESASRNPRMGKVAECTGRAIEILNRQTGVQDRQADSKCMAGVYFEWNDGGHFHEVERRFVRAVAWWIYSSRPYRADS